MSHINSALLLAAASAVGLFITGASIRRWLTGSPRQIEPFFGEALASCSSDVVPTRRAISPSTTRRRRWVRIALMTAVGVATIGPLPVVLVLVSWLSANRAKPLLRLRRHRHDTERELPGTIELLVLSIHAGLTPDQAIRELAQLAHEATRSAFVAVAHRMDRGEPLVDALAAIPETLGPHAVGLAEVIGSAARYGLPLSQVLDQLSAEARNTRRRLDEAAARRLPVQLSFPLVVCTLPSFILLAIAPAVIAALSSLGESAP